ncbi:MAG: hypothetical protein ACOYB3_00695 [Azonexus sp.]
MFASQVAVKDKEVQMRNGEKVMLPTIVVNVYNSLKAAGCNLQSAPRPMILGAAARLSNGEPVPAMAPAPAPAPAAPKAVKKKEAAAPETTPTRPQQSTTKPVVVTTARAGAPRPIVIEKPLDTDVVQRYQCAVAGAQLLAALHQLFEKDNFPGHEVRRKKLDDLIDEVEKSSALHVNLSVKAIICAQTSTSAKQTPV